MSSPSPTDSSSPLSRQHQLLFTVLLLVGLLVFGEAATYLALRLSENGFGLPDPARHVATAKQLRHVREPFDAELGWVEPYDTPRGERPRATSYGRPWIATFGDSFTHGDEVEAPDTWAEQLSGLLEVDVYNFGTGAYGMDQALLRSRRELERNVYPHAVYSFISYDIKRNLTSYWKFISPKSHIALTKPRFVLSGDGLELLPNPIRSLDELEKLADEDFVRQLGARDDWYNRFGLPEASFPRLRIFFSPALWRYALRRPERRDPWELDAPRELSRRILLGFHETCRERDVRPILMHLPVVREARAYAEEGELPLSVETFRELCDEHGLECLLPIETLEGRSTEEVAALFTLGLRGGHFTVEGNRWIARFLAERAFSSLRRSGMSRDDERTGGAM